MNVPYVLLSTPKKKTKSPVCGLSPVVCFLPLNFLNRASAQIIVDETTGLRVPIDAIHYLKEDGTESETQGENYIPGVYVKYGNLARFCKIDPVDNDHPLVTDGEYRIVMPSSSDKTKTVSEVRLYDEIIVSGQNLYDGKLL